MIAELTPIVRMEITNLKATAQHMFSGFEDVLKKSIDDAIERFLVTLPEAADEAVRRVVENGHMHSYEVRKRMEEVVRARADVIIDKLVSEGLDEKLEAYVRRDLAAVERWLQGTSL